MLYSDAWGKLIHEKTRSRKSRDTVPLKIFFGFFRVFTRSDLRNVYVIAGLVIVRLHSQTAQVVRVFGPAHSGTGLTRYL
jgi:hypothetical protein